jgi:PAS domain S-box-containing protein
MSIDVQEKLKFENACQQLLINLAARLINYPVEKMDDAITDALRQIVEFLGSVRSSINQFNDDRTRYKPRYVWPEFNANELSTSRFITPNLGSYRTYLDIGQAIKISNINDLPEGDALRLFLVELNVTAVVIVPILHQGKVLGFISTSWREPQGIQAEAVGLLQVMGEIFINAMDRRDNEARIHKFNEELTRRVEERTQELISVNKRLEDEIVERELIEKALRASEERYRIVAEVISDYAFLYTVEPDKTLKLEWITAESYERLSGYSVRDGLQPSSAYSPEYKRQSDEDVQRTIEGHITEREYRVVTKNGDVRWIYMRRFPIWDVEHTRVIQFYGVAQEITARKAAEEALRESEERYRIVTEVISDYAFLYAVEPDKTLKLEWVTAESYKRLTGYSVNELDQSYRRYDTEDAQLAREDVQRTLAGQLTEREYRVVTKSGEMRWIYMRRFPIWDAEHTRVVRFYGVAQEITARKVAEEALRLSEERYRIVTEVISDYAFVCTVDVNHNVKIEWITEDSFSRLTGYPKGNWGTAFSLYHPDDVELAKADTKRAAMGETTQREYRIITRSGEIRWVNLRRYPVWDDQHERVTHFYGVAQDITERKRVEAAEREQRRLTLALLDIADALNSTLDLEEVLDRILTNLERIATHNMGSILLIESGMARVVRASKFVTQGVENNIENLQFPIAETPNLRHVYQTREPLIIPDVKEYTDWIDVPDTRWVRCHVCIPIKQDNQVIGFLTWDNPVPNSFNPTLLDGLLAFAHQTAIAITNAKLYKQGQTLAVMEDRQQLARDLHDAVTQTLFSANMIAEMLPRQWENDPEQARRGLNQMHYLTRGALAEMRLLLMELRPEALDGANLPRLITQLSEAFTGQTGIVPTLVITGEMTLSQEIKVAFYRIAQEALNNISKHARATQVNINLTFHETVVILTVSDNGRGFLVEQPKSGSLGLKIMAERAEKINAHFNIESQPGIKTTLTVEWTG